MLAETRATDQAAHATEVPAIKPTVISDLEVFYQIEICICIISMLFVQKCDLICFDAI